MYDELVRCLRGHSQKMGCADNCICKDAYKRGFGTCSEELVKLAADAIEELSRRETPMRLRITTSTKRCPSCNKQVSGIGNIHGNYRYCRWCGQAIDWSESPKEE